MQGSNTVNTTIQKMRREATNSALVSDWPIEDVEYMILTQLMASHQLTTELISDICDVVTLREENDWATGSRQGFQRQGEKSTTRAQRSDVSTQFLGAPLERWGDKVAWTFDAFRNTTQAEFIRDLDLIVKNARDLQATAIQRALTMSVSYTFIDELVDNGALNIMPLANGSTWIYPNGANGKPIATNHNHLLGKIGGSWGKADVVASYRHMNEHYPGATLEFWISSGDVSAWQALTPDFQPYPTPQVRYSSTSTYALGATFDYTNENMASYAIGRYNNIEVIVKFWVTQGYHFCVLKSASAKKPLKYRVRGAKPLLGADLPLINFPSSRGTVTIPGEGGLQMVQKTNQIYTVEEVFIEFGVAVQNRLGAVVTDMNNSVYVAPSPFTP